MGPFFPPLLSFSFVLVGCQVWALVWYMVYNGNVKIPNQAFILRAHDAHGLDHRWSCPRRTKSNYSPTALTLTFRLVSTSANMQPQRILSRGTKQIHGFTLLVFGACAFDLASATWISQVFRMEKP